ncbi:MAG: DNA repair protein RecO [Planctomycetota bacterium]|jgi:DNA repair protein RecO (recombination protein O)
MPSEKATTFVLRTIAFMETSLVVTLFTREHGKVRALAKGARRPKNPFDFALDLLALCRIVFLRKSSESLDLVTELVTEAKLLRRFRPSGRNLASLYAGYYVAELLGELTDDYDPHPELFDLADETLSALSAGEPVANRVLRFELVALRLLGHLPSLDRCAECGQVVPLSGRVAFGHAEGGVVCERCRQGRRPLTLASAGVLRAMAGLADPTAQAWRRLEIDDVGRGELRGLLNRYLYNLLGKKLRMHKYLSMLSS